MKGFIKFYIAGGTTTLLQLAVLFVLTEMFGIWYMASVMFAILISFAGNFYLNRFWTFTHSIKGRMLPQWGRFIVTGVSVLVMQSAVIFLLSEFLMVWYMASAVAAVAIVSVLNYFMNRDWVFKT